MTDFFSHYIDTNRIKVSAYVGVYNEKEKIRQSSPSPHNRLCFLREP